MACPHIPSEEEFLSCIRCGLCLSVCPTYRETLTETASPRGRVALARKHLQGKIALSSNLIEQLYSCFTCMACDAACPVGIQPAQLVAHMRQYAEARHPAPWKQVLFGSLIPHPERLEALTLPLRLYQRTGLSRSGFAKRLPSRLRDLQAMLPPIPKQPLRGTLPELTPASGEEKYRVGFFLGCAQSLLFAEQSAASVRVLARNRCTVLTPRHSVCCGMPALGYGCVDFAQKQARHNIELFEKLDCQLILTDCATCGSTLKDYGRMLADDPRWASRAADFSRKIRDISEFLASLPLQPPSGRIEARVTYHDPCHLRRGQGVWRQPRQLLEMIDGLELIELPEADWCCGSAGSQLITHYRTSTQVLGRKMRSLKQTGAHYIASGCPGCQMQLASGIQRSGLDVEVVHPVQLLDQAYRNGDQA
jgi:glycolate oxidase iron-sulfur subunit